MDGGTRHTVPARGRSCINDYQAILYRLAILNLNDIQRLLCSTFRGHLAPSPTNTATAGGSRNTAPAYTSSQSTICRKLFPSLSPSDRGFYSLEIQRQQF